jgi:hypothetical protein
LQKKEITWTQFHNDIYDAGNVLLSHDGEAIIGATYAGETTEVELFE